ncbi:MAG: YbhB/YbcL family Raf kinase inhibitor-like protein [Nitrospira sp.]|nr:YbhB/YbcL family Raf kinase inhibitor-like protein [bacterium]MBL7049267.1 YbhB/YbcL family Raf kinase inhibitor-like protein [Nitrospira sp.]
MSDTDAISNISVRRRWFGRLAYAVYWLIIFWTGMHFVGQLERPAFLQIGDIEISSPAFQNGQLLDLEYTSYGANINPPLKISRVPLEAKSLVILADDEEGYSHWVVWNISPYISEIAPAVLPAGALEGRNDFETEGYFGACQATGSKGKKKYFFSVYALDIMLELKPGVHDYLVIKAMEGHVLAQSRVWAYYDMGM